ncbi:MAG TPA: class I SAM-dependent methyltransferase [Phenylobacterium sp.]
MTGTQPANAQQAELWNTQSGPAWVEMQVVMDRMLAPFGDAVLEHGFPGVGGQVLDIGCGAGATTLAMAGKVGANGGCLGVDISEPLLAAARAGAERAGAANVRFALGDAQTHAFEPAVFDAAISRFGVMFFDDPAAAFSNIRRGVKPGGRLAFLAWRSPADNPFMTAATRALAQLLPPAPPPEPGAPGQFGLADPTRFQQVLVEGGWRDVEIAPLDVTSEVSTTDLMAFATKVGPAAAALRQADAATVAKARALLEQAFAPYVSGDVARFTGGCWLATALA